MFRYSDSGESLTPVSEAALSQTKREKYVNIVSLDLQDNYVLG